MVVVASEFGRTPKIFRLPKAKLPGRDHWGAVQSALFAGGGVKGGTVIGASDKVGAYPAEDPQKPENFAATIYDALGIPRDAQWHEFMTTLGAEGITALLVEGGGETAARLLRAAVVDKVALFIAPLILGGTGSRPAVGGANPPALIDGYRIRNMAATPSGDDILLTGYLSDVHRFD